MRRSICAMRKDAQESLQAYRKDRVIIHHEKEKDKNTDTVFYVTDSFNRLSESTGNGK